MAAIDHWHPVLLSHELEDGPVKVRVWNQSIVVFRTLTGLGALEDRCPHRMMSLSQGRIEGDRIVCKYHNWSFDRDGRGQSPCNPRMKPSTLRYEVAEYHDAIWVRSAESNLPLPRMEVAGLHLMGQNRMLWRAPLELAFDNIAEVEHAPSVHRVFLFDMPGLLQLTPAYEFHPDHIQIVWEGPQRPAPWWQSAVLGAKTHDHFVCTVQVGFSPVYFSLEHVWSDRKTRAQKLRVLELVFLTPLNEGETQVTTFFYTRHRVFHPRNPLRPLARRIFYRLIETEIDVDRQMVEAVAQSDKRTDLRGMQLGIFDRALRPGREMIDRIYHGRDGGTGRVVSATDRTRGAPASERVEG